MNQPGRKFAQGSGYRYGFNGQERDKELNENITTAEHWEYDGRIARRWNIDPINKSNESPYLTFSGNPIKYLDKNGADTTTDQKVNASPNIKKGLDKVKQTQTAKNIIRNYDQNNPQATDSKNTSINWTVTNDNNLGTSYYYIIGKDGNKYYGGGGGSFEGKLYLIQQSLEFISKNFDKNSKVVYTISVGKKYYQARNELYSTETWGHELAVHVEKRLGFINLLRTEGPEAFGKAVLGFEKNLNPGVDKGMLEHPLAYLGYNQTYISMMNQIGISLKVIDAQKASNFKQIVIKVGIDYYKDDYDGQKRQYPNIMPDRKDPKTYLKF